MKSEWMENVGWGGGVVDVEEENVSTDVMSVRSTETAKSAKGFGFLDELEINERDDKLEEKIGGTRKRKREMERGKVNGGMYGVPGWR